MRTEHVMDEVAVLARQSSEVVTIDGKDWEVREWSIRQLVKVAPLIEGILDALEKRGLTGDLVLSMLEQAPKASGDLPLAVARALLASLPFLPGLIEVSTGRDKEEVQELSSSAALLLAFKIIGYNLGHLSRFFADALGRTTATPSGES